MKKLFIPTSTLNVSKILATASISPAIFDPKFVTVEPNNDERKIFLYSKYPKFQINSYEQNYPMVIEVEISDEFFKELKPYECGLADINVYSYDDTINLYSGKCCFYFKQESDLISTKTGVERESSAKYQGYRESFKVYDGSDFFEWSKDHMERKEDKIKKENDKIIDRIKGFALGYTVGANESVDDRSVNDMLRTVFEELKDRVNTPKEFDLRNKFKEDKKKKDVEDLIEIKDKGELNIKDCEDSEYGEFYHYLINEIIYKDCLDRFPLEKLTLESQPDENDSKQRKTAVYMGRTLKALLKKNDVSEDKIDKNAGVEYLRGYCKFNESSENRFDYFSEDNDILEGIAAYCSKVGSIGTNNTIMNNLKSFLSEKNFNSYKYALGILGAEIGFSQIDKDFIQFDNNGKDFFSKEFNKNVNNQLKKSAGNRYNLNNSSDEVVNENKDKESSKSKDKKKGTSTKGNVNYHTGDEEFDKHNNTDYDGNISN